MSVASLLARHGTEISIYRKEAPGKDEYGQQTVAWVLLDSGVPFELQLGPGRLDQEPFAMIASGHYPAFGLSGVGLVQGDGIQIDEHLDPTEVGRRFVVERGKDFGARGGWQGEVSETSENFGTGTAV